MESLKNEKVLFPLLTITSSVLLARHGRALIANGLVVGLLPRCFECKTFEDKLKIIIGAAAISLTLSYTLKGRYAVPVKGLIAQSILQTAFAYFLQKKKETTTTTTTTTTTKEEKRLPKRTDYNNIKAENLHYMKTGEYTARNRTTYSLRNQKALHSETRAHKPLIDLTLNLSGDKETEVHVFAEDSLNVAKKAVDQGYRTVVLNFASSREFGGAFTEGQKGSQEEEICYRSTLGGVVEEHYLNLDNPKFQLATNTGNMMNENADIPDNVLLTPGIQVFRDDHYQLMDEPFEIGILTCAAVVRMGQEGIPYNSEQRTLMKALIRTQLNHAYDNGYTAFISGAFGCGKFANPPREVAEIYKELLDTEFKGVFDYVAFAILRDQYDARKDNFTPFQEIFTQ